MILMSTAASRPKSAARRKRSTRVGFTSSLIAGTALTAALLAPAGVAGAQTASPAIRTVAHSAPLAPSQEGDNAGSCLEAAGGTACFFANTKTQANASGSGESGETSEGGTGSSGFDPLDWLLKMVNKIAPAVTSVANAVTAGAGAVSSVADTAAKFSPGGAAQGVVEGAAHALVPAGS